MLAVIIHDISIVSYKHHSDSDSINVENKIKVFSRGNKCTITKSSNVLQVVKISKLSDCHKMLAFDYIFSKYIDRLQGSEHSKLYQ